MQVTRAVEDLDREAQAIEQFVRHDIVRRSRGVPMQDPPTTNEDLGEYTADDGDQVQQALILASSLGDVSVLRSRHNTCAPSSVSPRFSIRRTIEFNPAGESAGIPFANGTIANSLSPITEN